MSDFNWNNVSNDLEVINLFVEREKIEEKIKAIDEFSLVKYEYEKLGIDQANEDIKQDEKALAIQGVSQQRELLKAFEEYLNSEEAGYYTGDFRINEFLEAFNCG